MLLIKLAMARLLLLLLQVSCQPGMSLAGLARNFAETQKPRQGGSGRGRRASARTAPRRRAQLKGANLSIRKGRPERSAAAGADKRPGIMRAASFRRAVSSAAERSAAREQKPRGPRRLIKSFFPLAAGSHFLFCRRHVVSPFFLRLRRRQKKKSGLLLHREIISKTEIIDERERLNPRSQESYL